MIDRLLASIAPHSCCSCGNPGSLLCVSCKNDIVSEPFSACFSCLSPTVGSSLCQLCRTQLGVVGGWCVGSRDGAVKNLLDRYKFSSAREAADICASLLDQCLPLIPLDITVVPVPTSAAHRRVRGFDHIHAVAHAFAKSRSLPCLQPLARRGSDTQHFKNRSERLRYSGQDLEIHGRVPKRVLLIDDIYTTGATLRACIRKLTQSGAEDLYIAIIARQTLDETSDLW